VPEPIRRAGFDPHGRAWCLEHWGVAYPLDRLSYTLTERKERRATKVRGRGRLVTLAYPQIVYEFFTRDRSPWALVAAICQRWPALEVQLRPYPLEPLVSVGIPASEIRVKSATRQRDRLETVKGVYGQRGGRPSPGILPKSFLNQPIPPSSKVITLWETWRAVVDVGENLWVACN
jgi:hypothetical protein